MNNQLTIFDAMESNRLKEAGMLRAACEIGADEWVKRAREVALMLAMRNGETDIEWVLRIVPRPDSVSPNASGSVFKDSRFVCVGRKRAEKTTSHAREIRVWGIRT